MRNEFAVNQTKKKHTKLPLSRIEKTLTFLEYNLFVPSKNEGYQKMNQLFPAIRKFAIKDSETNSKFLAIGFLKYFCDILCQKFQIERKKRPPFASVLIILFSYLFAKQILQINLFRRKFLDNKPKLVPKLERLSFLLFKTVKALKPIIFRLSTNGDEFLSDKISLII